MIDTDRIRNSNRDRVFTWIFCGMVQVARIHPHPGADGGGGRGAPKGVQAGRNTIGRPPGQEL